MIIDGRDLRHYTAPTAAPIGDVTLSNLLLTNIIESTEKYHRRRLHPRQQMKGRKSKTYYIQNSVI